MNNRILRFFIGLIIFVIIMFLALCYGVFTNRKDPLNSYIPLQPASIDQMSHKKQLEYDAEQRMKARGI